MHRAQLTRITPCRRTITDRFPTASFIVQVPRDRLFEVVCATRPSLLHADGRGRRTPRNFYTTRAGGLLRAPAGSANVLLPPEQLQRFAGSPRLYYAVATYGSARGDDPRTTVRFDALPATPYLGLQAFTGRTVDRRRLGGLTRSSARYGARAAVLSWGGDVVSGRSRAAGPAASAPYDDGYDPSLWTGQRAPTAPAEPVQVAAPARRAMGRLTDRVDRAEPADVGEPYTYGSRAAGADEAYGAPVPGPAPTAHRSAARPRYGNRSAGGRRAEAEAAGEEPGMADTSAPAEAMGAGRGPFVPVLEVPADLHLHDQHDEEPAGTPDVVYGGPTLGGSGDAPPDLYLHDQPDEAPDHLPDVVYGGPTLGSGGGAPSDVYLHDQHDEGPDHLPDVEYEGRAPRPPAGSHRFGTVDDAEEEPDVSDWDVGEPYGQRGEAWASSFLDGQQPPLADVDPPGAQPVDEVRMARLLYAVSEARGHAEPFGALEVDERQGVCLGIGRFDQASGALGQLLSRYRQEDPQGYRAWLGDDADELIRVTSSHRIDERMGPIAGRRLSDPAWTGRLTRLAGHRPFQRAQLIQAAERHVQPHLRFAGRLGLHRDRDLAALVARSQDVGPTRAQADVAEAICPIRRKDVDRGQVAELDRALRGLGFDRGDLRARLRAFQQAASVPEAGAFGPATQAALVASLRRTGAAPVPVGQAAFGGSDTAQRLLTGASRYLADDVLALGAAA